MDLLLVPGFMADADLWRDVEPGLSKLGPIHHADLTRDASIAGMARRALDEGPASSLVIGFSMGGYVARDIARLAPHRVPALVLVATSARPDTADQARRKTEAAAQMNRLLPFAGLSRRSVTSALHPDHAGDAALVARVQAMAVRLGAAAFRQQSLLERPGDLERLCEIHCRTLILAGSHDRLRSAAEAEELHRGIEGSQLIVIDGAGHMIPMEAPQACVSAVTSWLAAARPAPSLDRGG